MKGIKAMMGALAAAASLLLCVNAAAQQSTKRGPYETNKAFDNLYIQVGAGINATILRPNMPTSTWGKAGIATDLSIGKWFTPAIGMNLGLHGLSNNSKLPLDLIGIPAETPIGFHYFHGDLLWNISNSIGGYKPSRIWDFVPYFGFGIMDISSSRSIFNPGAVHEEAFAASLGLKNMIKVIDQVDIFLNLSTIIAKGSNFASTGGSMVALFPSATIGLSFNLGNSGFTRHADILPVVVPVPFTEDQYYALAGKVEALEKENSQLREKASALENELSPYRNLVNGQTYLYENGSFTVVDVKAGAPVGLYFDCGSAKLSAREIAHLEFFLDKVVDENTRLAVNGYSDKQTGSAKRNQQLSEQRVKTVVDYLQKAGVPESNIEAKAHGASVQPFNSAPKNRIVTIEVL